MVKEIKLTRGQIALVDDEFFELISKYKWHCAKNGYAVSRVNKKKIYMHRLILNAPDGQKVDHVNRIKTDNRLENLRLVTSQQNMFNRVKNTNVCTSVYKGVYKNNRIPNFWSAYICIDGKRHILGGYKDEILAAKAYDLAARYYFKEFALTNFEGTEALPWDKIVLLSRQHKNRTSKYRGVYQEKRSGKWIAMIKINYKTKNLGSFINEIDAAKKYNEVAKEAFGEKTILNYFEDDNG